jgi:hypothetical protein
MSTIIGKPISDFQIPFRHRQDNTGRGWLFFSAGKSIYFLRFFLFFWIAPQHILGRTEAGAPGGK